MPDETTRPFPDETPPPAAEPPRRHPMRYEVLRLHARGGLGEVYLAHDAELNREVALKRMQEAIADNSDLRRRFLLEAELTGRLEHPGVVPVYGLGADERGRPFYAMRFVQGGSLQEAIARQRQEADPSARLLGLRALLGRFLDACNAVAYAHSRGVIHRDLKPANIMLGDYGETFVVDWGLARPSGEAEGPLPLSPEGLPDATRGAIGSPAYMSPEQAEGPPAEIGPASDVYSLGATLYAVLTGRPPFDAASVELTLAAVRRGDFSSPRSLDPGVPAALEAVCLKAMARRPEGRYPSAAELARDVELYLADEPVGARKEPITERIRRFFRRHRALALSLGLLLLGSTLSLAIALARVSDANRAEREARAGAEESAEKARRQRDEADAQRRKADEARRQADEARLRAEQSERNERRQRYATNVSLARQAWQAGRVVQARQLLRDLLPRPGQEDLRGFEWRYLWRLVHEAVPTTFRPHLGPVASAVFTPDGKHVVTGGGDGCVLLWEAQSGRPVRWFAPDPDDRGGTLGLDWDVRGGRIVVASVYPLGPATLDGRLRPGDELVGLAGRTGIASAEQARQFEAGPAGSAVAVEVRRRGRPFRVTLVRRHVPRDALQSLPAARAALTADGRTLVTAVGRAVCLWDVQTGARRHAFRLPGGTVLSLALSPDGRLVATGDNAGIIRLWDVERRHPAGTIAYRFAAPGESGHAAQVRALAFSADGKTLLAGASTALLFCDPQRRTILDVAFQLEGGVSAVAGHPAGKQWLVGGTAARDNLELWGPLKRQLQSHLAGHAGAVRAVAFTPDGDGVLSGGADSLPRLWDRQTGKEQRSFPGHARPVTGLACSPDGDSLVSADAEGVVVLHDLRRGAEELLGRSSEPVHDVAFTPDGQTLFASAGLPGDPKSYVAAWDAQAMRFRGLVQGPPPELGGVTFSPDGKLLLVAESPVPDRFVPGVCRIYDVAAGRQIGQLAGHEVGVLGVAAPPSGDVVVTSDIGTSDARRRGELIFWDPNTRLPVKRVRPHAGMIGLALSPDGKTLLTHGFDGYARDRSGEVFLWDVGSRSIRGRVAGELAQTTSVALSPDGKLLVTATADLSRRTEPSPVQVWDAATGRPLVALTGHQSFVEAVVFAPDGNSVWLGNAERGLRVHDPRSGRLLRTVPPFPGWVSHLAFAPGGRRLAVAVGPVVSRRGELRPSQVVLLDAASGQERARFELTPGCLSRVAFSPDGKRLAISTSAGDLVVFEFETGRRRTFAAEPGRQGATVERLAVSPDGKTLATGGWDQTVKLWDVRPAREGAPARLRRTLAAGGVVSCLAFAPDGKTLAWGTGNLRARQPGGLTLYDLEAGKHRADIPTRPAGVSALAYSPDGSTLAVATDHSSRDAGPSEVWLVAVKTGAVQQVARRGRFFTHDLAFSPDGTRLAIEQAPNLEVVDLPTGAVTTLRGHARHFTRFAFAPDGKTLVSANADGSLRFWQVATGRELLALPHDEPVESLAFSRDGRTLAAGGKAERRGVVRLWRAGPAALLSQTWYADPGDGAAQRRASFDDAGRLVEEAFYDAHGAPAVGPDGYHRFTARPRPRYEDARGEKMPAPG